MTSLEIRELKKSFTVDSVFQSLRLKKEKKEVLRGLSFSVKSGHITGFLGSNGAGKTTTLQCVLGFIHPDAGEVYLHGERVARGGRIKSVGFLPERPYFYEHLTGKEFLQFFSRLSGPGASYNESARVSELLRLVRLEDAGNRLLRHYSKGMLQRIGLAQALIHQPKLIILDEPMAGLDPDSRLEMSRIIKAIAADGAAVFFSSHLLHDAELLCQDLVIIRQGALVYEGPTLELLQGLNSGFRITYGSETHQEVVVAEDKTSLQSKIDTLRSQRKEILDVRLVRPSLEEAFERITKI